MNVVDAALAAVFEERFGPIRIVGSPMMEREPVV
jgi:hypothetical protein